MADRRTGLAALALAGLAAAVPSAARAGLEICNRTEARQSVAIGYKGETDWTSEGWWNIDPGDCATLVSGDLTKRYYYYHAADSRTLAAQGYVFCTKETEFSITGDTDCEKRGFQTRRFREIDTGETAVDFTLTLPEPAGAPPVSATGTGPGGGARAPAASPPPPVGADNGIPAGTHGAAFSVDALFQGCEIEDGRAYCGFHAGGGKLRAFYDGQTPSEMLHALETLPLNTPVALDGDRLGAEALQTAVVLRAVRPRPGGDPDAELRDALQGDWVAERDSRSDFTIRGSEVYIRYDGGFYDARFLRLASTCDAAGGAGPVMIQTKPGDRSTVCFVIGSVEDGVLELTDPTRGARLRFRAER